MDVTRIADEVRRGVRAGDPTALDDLSVRFHYSPTHLSRRFHARTGMRLRDFHIALRIERAIQTLVAGSSVAFAQAVAGHASAATFSHSFRRMTGVSPSQYRRLAKELASTMRAAATTSVPLVLTHRARGTDPVAQPHALTVRVVNPAPNCVLFLALNPTPIAGSEPFLGLALVGMNEVVVDSIPDGRYWPMVIEVPLTRGLGRFFHMDTNRRAIGTEPVILPLAEPGAVEFVLRGLDATDPPITANLPELFLRALNRRGSSS